MIVQKLRWGQVSSLMMTGVVLICFSGCSVFMAAKQPSYKDLSVLESGNRRVDVVAELGAPVFSEQTTDGKKKDVFVFTQGYSKGNKVSRAMFHGVADVFSLGLWEVIGTPAEAIADGKKMKLEVVYDANDKVEKADFLDKAEKSEQKK